LNSNVDLEHSDVTFDATLQDAVSDCDPDQTNPSYIADHPLTEKTKVDEAPISQPPELPNNDCIDESVNEPSVSQQTVRCEDSKVDNDSTEVILTKICSSSCFTSIN